MPTWGQILNEINVSIQGGNPAAFDQIRRKYVSDLQKHTGRNLIIYASKWTTSDIPPNLVIINDEDIQGFMEAVNGLKGDSLDLLLHTGGGSAESTDAIVSYLRQKFSNIRVIIPQAALSAGTMLACAADEIVMAKHSSIGPIDPQMILQTQMGVQAVPAHSILEQFDKAKKDIANNPQLLNSWLPMISQYGPALLITCKNQIAFGRELVKNWLNNYMFKGDQAGKGDTIAEYLSDHGNFLTHSKHINVIKAKELGFKVFELESDAVFQDKVLSAFHATMLTFNTAAVKIICNHLGNTFVKQQQPKGVPIPLQMPLQRPK